MSNNIEAAYHRLAAITEATERYEARIAILANKRAMELRYLNSHGITLRKIAARIGVAPQTVINHMSPPTKKGTTSNVQTPRTSCNSSSASRVAV